LEELVLKIGYDPANVKAAEEMIKKKNADIASLRKQLKLPPTEDSQTREIAEKEGEKDEMLKLLMEQNAQLKEMEAEMERLLKEKEQLKPNGRHSIECYPNCRIEHNSSNNNSICNTSDTTRGNSRPRQIHGEDEPARDRDQQA
jgi:hypothetical protein